MGYRTGLQIKKLILDQLTARPYVLSELERKINSNGRVLKRHLDELAYLGLVQLDRHPRHPRTGRPYTIAAINLLLISPSLPVEYAVESHRSGSEEEGEEP